MQNPSDSPEDMSGGPQIQHVQKTLAERLVVGLQFIQQLAHVMVRCTSTPLQTNVSVQAAGASWMCQSADTEAAVAVLAGDDSCSLVCCVPCRRVAARFAISMAI